MENNIQHIELINQYLNKTLSEKEIQGFENRLKTDESFTKEFETHVLFLEGLKRQQLKGDIKKAKHSYVRNKWFKYLGFTSGLLILIVSVISYINVIKPNTVKPNPTQSEIHNSVTVLDSVVSNDSIEEVVVEDRIKTEQPKIKEAVIKNEVKAKKAVAEVKIPKKSHETFTINHKRDTIITCKEGTKLTIRANSFVDQNNKIVTEKIDLRVTEYYQLSDIMLANLSTQSDGRLLETGGMLNLQAYKGDEPLSLKQNSNIEILFPTKKKNMQLFSGEWENGNVNWSLASVDEEIDMATEEIEVVVEEDEDIDVPFSVIENVPVFPGCENKKGNQAKKDCMSDKIKKFVNEKFKSELAIDLGLSGRQRINVIFKIDKTGSVVGVRSRAPHPELEEEAARVINLLPKMKPGKQRGKAVNVPYSLPIIFEANGVPGVGRSSINRRRQDSIYTKRFENRLTGKDSTKVTVTEVSSYILRTSKLGWINCDRFTRSSNRIKYKLKIEDAKGVIRVKMVFKSMNSVLPSRRSGKEFDFKMVPKNEDVILIAIKQDEGKLYLDIVDTKTEETPNIKFNFKEINLEELKSELKKLNKLF